MARRPVIADAERAESTPPRQRTAGGPVERGVEVVEPQVCLCRAGQVDGVAARVLVIAPVVGGDRGVEAADGLGGVAEVKR